MSPTDTSDAVAAVIRERRTIERFRPGSPPRELILQAMELACWAPNHKHTQPWRFHLLGPQSTARLIEINTELVRHTQGDEAAALKQDRWSRVPGWLALTCAVSIDPIRAEEDYAACCCAAQNMALFLWTHGIGMKWSTGPVTRTDEFARLLGMEPAERRIVGLFAYGYPESIPEGRRRPLPDVLQERP